jgi:UDP-N-acetylmuramyl pentapeptide synthase
LAGAADVVETHQVATASEALELLGRLLQPGDVVLIKGSRGIGLDLVVDGLRAEAG